MVILSPAFPIKGFSSVSVGMFEFAIKIDFIKLAEVTQACKSRSRAVKASFCYVVRPVFKKKKKPERERNVLVST